MADYLALKYGFARIALADPIKRICMDLYEMTEDQLWGDLKEQPDLRYPIEGKGFLTPRVACQVIGTEVVRSAYPNTWVDKFCRTAKQVMEEGLSYSRVVGVYTSLMPSFLIKHPYGVACPDVRFKNEVKGIHAIGGLVIRLRRAGKEGAVGIAGHASEEEQKGIPDSDLDGVLDVQEGLSNYHQQIGRFMERLPKKKPLQSQL
jgi:hypothetical protein